jgi:protein-L-isoaspartate(D-aspartate) O-methyltransferase
MMTMSTLFEPIRYKLVEQQIRPWNVSDADVLNTLLTVHRERFVPANLAHLAFTDTQLPLPGATHPSQVMFEPKVEARVLQALKPTSKETVLEVGAGSGYMAALLAQYAKFVTTVDSDSQMVNLAKNNLKQANILNVSVEQGDAYTGWGDKSYDVICISGSMPSLYEGLKQQLAVKGRLFAIVGNAPVQRAILVHRHDATHFSETLLFETLVPNLQSNKVKESLFSF